MIKWIFFVCVVILLSEFNLCYQDDICKVPNGEAGTCVPISSCRPLWNLYYKKHKEEADHLYISQSFCGNTDYPTLKVCCPSFSKWSVFKPNPILFHNTINEELDKPLPVQPTTEPARTSIEPARTSIEPARTSIEPARTSTEPPLTSAPQGSSVPAEMTSQLVEKSGLDSPTSPVPIIASVLPLAIDKIGSGKEETFRPNNVGNVLNKTPRTFKNDPSCGIHDARGNRITGGEPTSITEYPWLVLLEYAGGQLSCGGSLFTSKFVLTAAHCVDSLNGRPIKARLGEYNTTSFPTDVVEVDGGGFEELNVTVIDIVGWWAHPNFSRHTLTHDIGILKLAEEAKYDYIINSICLPQTDYIVDLVGGVNLTVAGWGDDYKETEYFDIKKEVRVPYVPLDKCKSLKRETTALGEDQLCAGGEEGKDTCKGDSGGPLMLEIGKRIYALGVVSYGPRMCGTKGQPAVYTNVYKYMNDITNVINGLL